MRAFKYLIPILYGLLCTQAAIAGGIERPIKNSGFYLTASVGGATFQNQHSNSSTLLPGVQAVTTNEIAGKNVISFTWSAGIGWQFSQLFRIDLTYQYFDLPMIVRIFDTANTGPLTTATTTLDGRSDVYLLNGYIDLLSLFGSNGSHLRPYIGGGIGYAENKTKNSTLSVNSVPAIIGFIAPATRSDFAYQVLAGVNFPLTRGLRIFAQYSFLCAGKYALGNTLASSAGNGFFSAPVSFHIHSSIFSAGLTYLF